MESHYEINVSLNGRHFFATSPRSCNNKIKAEELFDEISNRFPKEEGFEVSCTHWEISGSTVKF